MHGLPGARPLPALFIGLRAPLTGVAKRTADVMDVSDFVGFAGVYANGTDAGPALCAVTCPVAARQWAGRSSGGLDRVRAGVRQTQLIKFCAIFGAVHLAFPVLYTVPSQLLATGSDQSQRATRAT